jgi:hypothetical protein
MASTLIRAADTLAREHTDTAIKTLAEVMSDPFAENKDRIKAAESLLDRGHGKPTQAIIALPPSRAQAARLAALSDDELLNVIQHAQLPRLAPLPEDATLGMEPIATIAGVEDDDLLK